MRIHREHKLCRSEDIKPERDCKKYVPQLRQDFHFICGYCGKPEIITTKGFEPDHFVPKRIDSSREFDYSNLVYSCFTCNRKKQGKWPTEDKDKSHDGDVGFIDPVLEEYDKHLGINEEGNIEFYTAVGEYMCKEAFKFDMRPIKVIWKIIKLIEAKERLAQNREKLTSDELQNYIELDEKISELNKILFVANE